MTLLERLVTSSTCSRMVLPSSMSPNLNTPLTSVMIGMVYGSQSASMVPGDTFCPSVTRRRAPYITGFFSRSRPCSSCTAMSPLRFMSILSPLELTAMLSPWKAAAPSWRASMVVCSALLDAVPPMWKVLMVSCVPGSPMDCAAMTPTASPISTMRPRVRSLP